MNVGANPPTQPEVTAIEVEGVASGPEPGADHGCMSLVTSNVPHDSPVIKAARGATEEVQLEIAEGQLRIAGNRGAVERRRQLPGGRIGVDLGGELDQDPVGLGAT